MLYKLLFLKCIYFYISVWIAISLRNVHATKFLNLETSQLFTLCQPLFSSQGICRTIRTAFWVAIRSGFSWAAVLEVSLWLLEVWQFFLPKFLFKFWGTVWRRRWKYNLRRVLWQWMSWLCCTFSLSTYLFDSLTY